MNATPAQIAFLDRADIAHAPDISREDAAQVIAPMLPAAEVDWHKTARGRSVYCLASELPAENAREARVCATLEAAPSFPALLKAYDRFRRDLSKYDYRPEVIRQKPWELLTAHAGVYKAKSARAQTLRRLALAIFSETGLPRQTNTGFRGTDGIDWSKA